MRLAYKRVTNNNFLDLVRICEQTKKNFVRLRTRNDINAAYLRKYITDPYHFAHLIYRGDNIISFHLTNLKFKKVKRAKFEGLLVKKKYRGRGYGTDIFQHFIKLAKRLGIKEIVSRTWSSNKAMQRIFEKSSFKKYKTIKNQRVNGDDTYWYNLRV